MKLFHGTTREERRALERTNKTWPVTLAPVPRDQWPAEHPDDPRRVAVFRSRDFLVQVIEAPAPAIARLSILRAEVRAQGWRDEITWDELQRLKTEAGFGFTWAVEVYPPALEVVNVANIRHLWLLPEAPAFAWRTGK